jgi:hypothetical protein
MDVKEAVSIAKAHARDVFDGETARIEEVWFEQQGAEWCVTIGLQRAEPASAFDPLGTRRSTRMHYKTVRINDTTKEIISVRNHDKMPVST